ncbi:MAG: heavy-metal-associated domain-containing protein [Proteobacteria bacterium]|jgi:copper chaperone CopZ|nr:heavy-metal-associated domain-containing protein [Pseudomonadota bacterium]MCG6936268.1 heavy-metal-associated domain-containing protein [Pseudomonadota bacterium]
MATLELKVQNVKCGGCASSIQDGLRPLPGIDTVQVDVETGTVRIEGDTLNQAGINSRLSELGYPVAN